VRGDRREEREPMVYNLILGNTVETQWRRLNIGLLLWGCFCGFFLFFSLNEGK
jgi:hypothetical protein